MLKRRNPSNSLTSLLDFCPSSKYSPKQTLGNHWRSSIHQRRTGTLKQQSKSLERVQIVVRHRQIERRKNRLLIRSQISHLTFRNKSDFLHESCSRLKTQDRIRRNRIAKFRLKREWGVAEMAIHSQPGIWTDVTRSYIQKIRLPQCTHTFIQLMVFTCFMFIFLMNHFDRIYIKFLLVILITSEILDSVWLFMNSSEYWSPSGNGTNSGNEGGYLKLIVFLTYLGIFLKIPLGVFLYHYRNV